ncbi:MAG: methyltransferase, partial [Pseudomonadota bacterium]
MSYSDLNHHRAMVFDPVRNRAYLEAIKHQIAPGKTVMDLGAGLGVLGLSAAKLGADHVHLVEPAIPSDLLRGIARDNQLAQITVHGARVEELEINTKVDMIISVFTGNFLLTEDLLPSLFLARDKFLAENGSLIPGAAKMIVMPVSVQAYYQKHVNAWCTSAEWFNKYGLPSLQFERVKPFSANSMFYDSADKMHPVSLAPAADLMELDFYSARTAACDSSIELAITRAGVCHGWLGWFQAKLGDQWLSTGPYDDSTHWNQVFMPLESPIELSSGDRVGFALQRPEFGDWTWSTTIAGQRQRQSTFLSQQQSLTSLRRFAPAHKPQLNNRGAAQKWLLNQMAGDVVNEDLTRD